MNLKSSEPLFCFEKAILGYESQVIVSEFDLQINQGDFTAVFGPNGGGKSTFIKAIVGELEPFQGKIRRNFRLKKQTAYLPQKSSVDRKFPITVRNLVTTALWHETGLFRGMTCCHRDQVDEALCDVGMAKHAERTLCSLSGGEFQRALFARMLVQKAPLMLLDEPFIGVDETTVEDLTILLKECHRQGRTIVIVLHDLDFVKAHVPRAIYIENQMVLCGDTQTLLREKPQQQGLNDNV